MIWKHYRNPKELNSLNKKTMISELGISFEEVGEDFITATLPVDQRTKQPAGLLHGGATAVLVETLGSVASLMCLDNIDTQTAVGTSISVSHLRSATEGEVMGVCSPIKIGRRLHLWHVEVYDEEEELIAVGQLTTMIIDKKK